ncbi:MAG: hypothetical protein JW932_18315 [Deltaproteobacteria bacterium]|nr:hypothetical protein [Deltaproteobacteria bacterium]
MLEKVLCGTIPEECITLVVFVGKKQEILINVSTCIWLNHDFIPIPFVSGIEIGHAGYLFHIRTREIFVFFHELFDNSRWIRFWITRSLTDYEVAQAVKDGLCIVKLYTCIA